LHTDCPHYYRFAEEGETEEEFLAGLVKSLENIGHRAYLHDAFEPELTCECFRPDPFDPAPCVLSIFDLNRDFIHDEADIALALTIWLGPCGETGFPEALCTRLDILGAGFGGNMNGELDEIELITYYKQMLTIRDGYCRCREDVTNDGTVDIDDVIQVMDAFGICGCRDRCIEDINRDLVVDRTDLDIVLQIALNNPGLCPH